MLACLSGGAVWASAADGEMVWRRRSLRQPAPGGYLVVATLKPSKGGTPRAAVACKQEKVELQAHPGYWVVLADGTEVVRETLADEPRSLFVKRTPATLLLGLNGRWVHSLAVGRGQGAPEVWLGASPALEVASFRVLAREPVRFADDFPDATPKTGVWEPVRGRWALSSLSFADRSANPAELAAVFDRPDDEASRGRTRQRFIGIGVQVGGAHPTGVVRMAGDSPAERAGMQQGDIIRTIDGTDVRSAGDVTALLDGEIGQQVQVVVERNGKRIPFKLKRDLVIWGKTRRFVPMLPWCEEPVALIVAGYDFWTDYRFTAAARTHDVGAFGLVFAYLGPSDYHAFRWLGASQVESGPGRWQIERVRNGRTTVLAQREGGFYPRDFYTLSVAIAGDQPGKVRARCSVDGRMVLAAADDAIVPGRIGFVAHAPGTVFLDDVWVGEKAHDPTTTGGTRNIVQLRDPTMKNWADPTYLWRFSGTQWWYKTRIPGDVAFSSAMGHSDLTRLVICASKEVAASGYALEVAKEGKQATLRREGAVVKQKAIKGALPEKLTLSRSAGRVSVAFDGKAWLTYEDGKPLRGGLVGASGVVVAQTQVESPNILVDYFNRCPTEWHVVRGHWEVMNRWVCDPRWSFFGGRNDGGLLAIWSKRALHGDCAIAVDVGPMMMELSGRYENMRDMAVTICGHNHDVASGYTVVVGADYNRRTVLYRRGEAVASTTDYRALLPNRRALKGELYSQHRGWMHIRLAREGDTVRFSLWGHEALTYRDPHPLPDGHCAIWNVENGMMLAKAQLMAEGLGKPEPQVRSHAPFSDHMLTSECAESQAIVEPHGSTYAVTNSMGGGPFAVALRPRVFSAFDCPRLSFDIKLSPKAKVDFYLTVQEQLYRVRLAGPKQAPWMARDLAADAGVGADGEWHHVELDLLGLLGKKYPDDKFLMVWEPMIGNFSNEKYLKAGFGGNGAGTTYWLRNIVFAPAEKVAHAPQTPPKD